MAEDSPDSLRAAAPAYDDVEARRARAGVAAALFGGGSAGDHESGDRVAVGRYEIASRLGAGGMGVVYRAHDPDLDRPVAVKLLHSDSSTDEKARARMLREARALAKLSHPNVITVYDVGTDDGRVFVAMELVAGLDLKRWLEQRPDASWREILALFCAAGRGLAAAHEAALIHRDFKPENVLVGSDGRVRVLDFGLARLHRPVDTATDGDRAPPADLQRTDGEGPLGESATNIAHLPTSAFTGGLTETGAMIGTPLYMAPEIYGGKPADERSDQFGFCASLYEGLYRQLPFGARTLAAHVEAVREGRVVEPPEDSPVPASLWRIVARGLNPDPFARHPDMTSLLDALERATAEPAVTALPSGSTWRWFAAALVVALAVTGLIGLELGWFFGSDQPGQAAAASPDEVRLGPVEPPVEAPESPPVAVPEPPEPEPEPEPGTSETGDGQHPELESEPPEPEPEPEPAPAPAPELHDWCHLHEDHLTLLDRSTNRRARFLAGGQCYACRVEKRRSRTRSFSPRDCAGYSLCGPVSAGECQ
ncbi:MAG TPA: serine/threonine-protein kinase [Enhygromyxa sp.]|nr:serine/threonine-protein kinase [Enhygromyxa sp.]